MYDLAFVLQNIITVETHSGGQQELYSKNAPSSPADNPHAHQLEDGYTYLAPDGLFTAATWMNSIYMQPGECILVMI